MIDHKVAAYHNVAEAIDVGAPKSKVLATLPDQTSLAGWGRPREVTIINGRKVEIYYFRTARVPDGKTTDDELVPYLYHRRQTARDWLDSRSHFYQFKIRGKRYERRSPNS